MKKSEKKEKNGKKVKKIWGGRPTPGGGRPRGGGGPAAHLGKCVPSAHPAADRKISACDKVGKVAQSVPC